MVSIVIPNLNSPIIDKVIKSLLKQNYKGQMEIIVVGMDKYNLLWEFKKNKKVKIIETPKPVIPSIARNIGLKKAKGDYLFLLDADCLVQKDWIKQLLKNYHQDQNLVVGGSFCIGKSENFWRFCDNLSHYYATSNWQKKGQVGNLPAANLSLPRHILEKVGQFDETLVAGEDKDFSLRLIKLGYPLIFEPTAGITHLSSRTSFFSILKHSFTWAPWSLKVRLKYSEIEKVPFFMKNRLTFFLATPVIALFASLRVYASCFYHFRYLCTLPIIFASKMCWCLGAFINWKEL